MHPIVNEYLNTGLFLSTILEHHCNPSIYLETIFLKICQLRNVVEVDPQIYQEIDQAVLQGHADTNVYMLFISIAIDFTSRRHQTEKSKVLNSIASSLSFEKIHTIVKSTYCLTSGTLKYYEDNTTEGDKLLKQSLLLIDKNHPRYFSILLGYATLISSEGRLNELGKDDLEKIYSYKSEQFSFICVNIKLSNCILTGNVKEGIVHNEEYKKLFPADAIYLVEGRKDLLKILSGEFDEKNFKNEKFKLYAKVCFNLLSGNLPEAIKDLKQMQKVQWQKVAHIPFEKYLPLHIALSSGDKGKARLLFQELHQNGSPNYMDDFFLARIQLLELDIESANQTFNRLMKNINFYDAMHRLAFEMQFAKELKTSDILFLMNGVKDEKTTNSILIKAEQHKKRHDLVTGLKRLVGESASILQVKKLIKQFSLLKDPVLITGETGTGKELVSRAIHEEGPFPQEPFLAINCGALTESLLQSELFGYVAGAFTGAQKERKGIFEAAGKGTVFLDEFGDISPKMQISLLRVLESNEIRLIGGTNTRTIACKIVIATNIDLHQAVKEKKFREDLYFRLARFDIQLPSLRDRVEDIPKLINYFLDDVNGIQKKLSTSLLEALKKYPWPGNIRELKNEMERLKILHSDKNFIEIEDFDFDHLQGFEKSDLKKEAKVKVKVEPQDADEDKILSIVQRGTKVDQRHEFIKGLFRKYKKLTRSQIMEIAKISPVTATKDMEMLCQSGFIERKTPTKSVKSHYFVLVE